MNATNHQILTNKKNRFVTKKVLQVPLSVLAGLFYIVRTNGSSVRMSYSCGNIVTVMWLLALLNSFMKLQISCGVRASTIFL